MIKTKDNSNEGCRVDGFFIAKFKKLK